jgi:preprotein translocase subunit SecE
MLDKVKDAPRDLVVFVGDVRTELKKVTWPSRKEVYGTTVVVIVTVFFFGAYLFVVDWLLSSSIRGLFGFF